MPTIADYAENKEFIEANANGAHHEAGDPKKAAEIIYQQVTDNYDDLPLRLPLGKISSDLAIEKYQENLDQLKQLRERAVTIC